MAVGVALIVHWVIVTKLSVAMCRYRGPGGRVVNSIALHPLHLVELALIAAAGLLMTIPVSNSVLPYQIGLAVVLAVADDVLVFRAIKSVDRFAD